MQSIPIVESCSRLRLGGNDPNPIESPRARQISNSARTKVPVLLALALLSCGCCTRRGEPARPDAVATTPSVDAADARASAQAPIEAPAPLLEPTSGSSSDPASVAPARGTVGRASSLHIGNSLTDTLVDWLAPVAASGGIQLDFNRYTVPGAGTYVYVKMPTGGFGLPDVRAAVRSRPFDHLTMQPFPNMPCQVKPSAEGDDSDSGYINQVWKDARAQNPRVELWVYQQWPDPQKFSNCLTGGGWTRGGWKPPEPKNWDDAVKNELAYDEAVRAELVRLNPNQRPPYIIPGGLALLALKAEIEAGRVPGMKSFAAEFFSKGGTDIHASDKGSYFITLVFYSCMFQKNPEGLTYQRTGLTADQALSFQRIAWKTVNAYPLSGVKR